MTAAADIQRAVLIHHRVVTRDFGTGGIFAVDNGFAAVVRGRVVTVDLCAGAAVADGVVAVVVDDGFITVDQNTDGIRIGNRQFNGNGVPKRSRFGTISKVCSLALATENIVLNTLQNKTGAVPTGIPF
ncbi:hypothetical protein [Escherichia coli]|uniref:hypothetical protein n=1 Tax=Escherichia coli TaxID=562 RepID=UPI003207E293